jgi:bifunctional DNase/RNase
MIEMTVESVRINLQTSQRVVILKATQQERYLFIWIAHADAYAIAIELQGTNPPRPLTHDLFIHLMSACEIKVVSCVISDLVDDIFYSYIEVDIAGRHVRVDARPSDAIAIAVRAKIPISVEDSVLERAGCSLEAGDSEKESGQQQSRKDQESFQLPDEESSTRSKQPIQEEDNRVQELSQEEADFVQTFGKLNQDNRDRFDKFTERARKVLSLAQEEARRFQHNSIGTEHLLLGLVREREGLAAGILESLGVSLEKVRTQTIQVLNPTGASHKEAALGQQGFALLGDRYQLQDLLGQDEIFTTYRGWDTSMKRAVTIQILRDEYSAHPKVVTRFQREAKVASSLQHPNIVQVYDYGLADGNYYIVTEMVEGTDLSRYLRSHVMLDSERAVMIAHDVALGLGAAHRRGIVHRDVKPQNVLMGRGGSIKLTDFGIGSVSKDMNDGRLNTPGMALGAVQYIAPEQALGEIVSPATDVYALGMVMYEMVTGLPPFDGDSPVAVAIQHFGEPTTPPSQLNSNISPALEEIILRCLEKVPEMRFRDGSSLARALELLSEST